MAVSDGDDHHRRQGPWASSPTCSTTARLAAPPRATSPSATPATPPPARRTWRNAQPVYRGVGEPAVRPRPQRQPHQHRGARRRGRDAARHGHQRHRPRRRAARPTSCAAPADERSDGRDLERALADGAAPARGRVLASSLMDEGHVIGVRDPNGFRPLCLGQLDDGWVLASETPGARHRRRPLRPRARPRRDGRHRRHRRPRRCARSRPSAIDPRLCLFEFVYFARPDSRLYGRSVHQARVAHGRAARRAGAGRGRHGHGRARVGRPRRRGLRPRAAASPTARAW